jgi:hypothetical protein
VNAAILAEWLKQQGYHVANSATGFWARVGPRFYQAIPYHWLIHPSEEEVQWLLKANGAIGLRYSTDLSAHSGLVSYHVFCESGEYSLDTLPKKARYDVRKGLRHATVEPISFHRLAFEGWELRQETLQRQGRSRAESQVWWRKLCNSAGDLPGFEAWAACTQGRLAASLLAFTCDRCYCILYQQSRSECLASGVNNALAFTVTSQALARPGIDAVFYGLHSLDAPSSVDEFKFRMGYKAKPVRQRIVFHPWLRPLFNASSHRVLRGLRRWQPGNATIAKAEGLVRFYREGRRPLPEQDWPPVLESRRGDLLASAEVQASAQ